MKHLLAALLLVTAGWAVTPDKPNDERPSTALTIYNQNFGVVRQSLTLDLNSGVNQIRFGQATAHVEPQSVILRDITGRNPFRILEQDYRNDPVSQELLLSLYEGRTIDFIVNPGATDPIIVKGKIIRSGYVPPNTVYNQYGQPTYVASSQPIIEVNGQMRFGLPGLPLFPDLGDDTILKPTLNWLIQTDQPERFDAEVSYVSGGLNWAADYNLVAPESGDTVDFIGWISFDNRSGKNFEDARVKLIAGDVNKITPNQMRDYAMKAMVNEAVAAAPPVVQEKAFDEYHMYTLQRAVTLHDNETKQVEFIRGTGVRSQRIYVYDGAQIPYYSYDARNDVNYGTQSNKKVWVVQEFKNTKENGLGIPLPKGRLRFYRRDSDGRLEFVGENEIDHTPSDETVRVYTGNTFDVVGERKRTNFHVDSGKDYFDESYEIRVRNHKKEAVTVRVVEHMFRWTNWQLLTASKYNKKDAQTVEFPVTIQPNGEAVIAYTVHYSW
jgi:hypothetical protein